MKVRLLAAGSITTDPTCIHNVVLFLTLIWHEHGIVNDWSDGKICRTGYKVWEQIVRLSYYNYKCCSTMINPSHFPYISHQQSRLLIALHACIRLAVLL